MASRILGIQFAISNPDDIIKRSAVEIVTDKTYVANIPSAGGVFDPRMGVIDNGKQCPTCKQTAINCPGHFGHLPLAVPVFHIHLLDYVVKAMKCICVRCSRLQIDADSEIVQTRHKNMSPMRVLDSLVELLKSDGSGKSYCGKNNSDGCGAIQAAISLEKGQVAKIIGRWKGDGPEPTTEVFSAEYVLRLFQRMSDRDINAIGLSPQLSRPEWMICTVLPVPPLAVRPSVMEDNRRMEDDITHKLLSIVKQNKRVRELIDMKDRDKAETIEKNITILQWEIATYIDNEIAGIPKATQRSGRPLKTFMSRLVSKEGRFRSNLMGKRVDYSARSVITPEPNISIDEVGVPVYIASNQSIPEVVSPFNRERLTEMVRNGPFKWPGAKTIRLASDGRVISLKIKIGELDKIELHDGDIVNRHLLDGDPVLMNRQPSLHRMSMMCHRVRVLPGLTFRLNPSACKNYNADFDGDI